MVARKDRKRIAARLAWIALALIFLTVALVPKDKLPASWQDNKTIIELYAKRDAVMNGAEPETKTIETDAKPAADATGKGYSDAERSKMDKLMNSSAQDH